MSPITLVPIGIVRSTRTTITDDDWDRERCYVELDTSVVALDALEGVEAFSHVEVVFHMDRVEQERIETGARHPRNYAGWPKVGIFAQRGKNRPNQIGATICRVVRVDGPRLHVLGLDAVDGSPVLDIKPWVTEFGPRGEVTQPPWITELMTGYWESNGRTP